MTVNERINFLVEKLEKGNQRQFALKVGVTPTVVGSFMPPKKPGDRVSKPSYEALSKIVSAYPDINAEWLLNGKGEPFKNPPKTESTLETKYVNDSRTLNKNTASGNTVTYGSVPPPAETSELEYLRARVRELEQKNNELLDKLLQILNK